MSDPDGALGAGAAEGADIAHAASGDATGGGDPGNPDAMGADDGRTVDEGAGRIPGTSDEIDGAMDGTADGRDPEALSHEREEYPDPESYPTPEDGEAELLDGTTPDADLGVDGERT